MTNRMPSTLRAVFAIVVLAAGIAGASDGGSSDEGRLGPPNVGPAEESIDGASLRSLRIAGSALRPREDDVSYTTSGTGGCIYVTAGDAFSVFNIALTELRQGATVDTLRMYFYDTSASNSTAWFTVYDLYGSIVYESSVSTNTTAGNSFNDSAQIGHAIDYGLYSYLLNWRPAVTGSTMQLCGFRIFYAE